MYFILALDIARAILYSPMSGPEQGGTIITITDGWFIPSANASCRFNSTLSAIVYYNISLIQCKSPGGTQWANIAIIGIQEIEIGPFTYYTSDYISSIFPLFGSEYSYATLYINVSDSLPSDELSVQISGYTSACSNLSCIIPPYAVLNSSHSGLSNVLPVYLSRNSQQFEMTQFNFTYLLAYADLIQSFIINSYHGPAFGGTEVQVLLGGNISMSNPMCLFGNVTSPGYSVTNSAFKCKSPGGRGKVELRISANGIDYSSIGQEFIYDNISIESYYPSQGTVNGNSYVVVTGDFIPYYNLSCKFGNKTTAGKLLLSSRFNCTTPSITLGTVGFYISLNTQDYYYIGPYTYRSPEQILSINPAAGPYSGGTLVSVNLSYINSTANAYCRIGSYYKTKLINNKCQMPPLLSGGTSTNLYVSSNDIDYESYATYTYYSNFTLVSVSPQLIPDTLMQRTYNITGLGFTNTSAITVACIGNIYAGVFVSSTLISFTASDQLPTGRVNISLSLNSQNYSPSFLYLDVYKEPKLLSINPNFGFSTGGIIIGVSGMYFIYSQTISVKFCNVYVQGTFVSDNFATFVNPAGTAGNFCPVSVSFNHKFNFTNQVNFTFIPVPVLPAIYPVSSYNQQRVNITLSYQPYAPPLVIKAGLVSVKISSTYTFRMPTNPTGNITFLLTYNYLETQSGLLFSYLGECINGYYCPVSYNYSQNICPQGYYCSSTNGTVPVPCPPGTYSNKGSLSCTLCSVGYYCPSIGMYYMLPCPDGYLCNVTGLSYTPISCNPGYACANNTINACNPGYWCGVGSVFYNTSVALDFRTPQVCRDGIYCQSRSISQYGADCPLGNYCISGFNYTCPVGYYCGTIGLYYPVLCQPGFYNPLIGQTSCLPCSTGHMCPGVGNTNQTICVAGYVCSLPGRPTPYDVCPGGSYCLEGVSTNVVGMPNSPIPCYNGSYCLTGCISGKILDGNIKYAQTCIQGSYCGTGESSPAGTPCPAGYYCPSGCSEPIITSAGYYSQGAGNSQQQPCPAGNYSNTTGSTYCDLCPAGYYCPTDKTIVPTICPAGSYRELISTTIYCELCPEGTYSPMPGIVSVTQCVLCDASIICLSRGSSNLDSSTPCPEGYVCGNGTTTSSLINSPCPGGFWCGVRTSSAADYEICDPGYYCPEATGNSSQHQFVCLRGYYCPPGTYGELNSTGGYQLIVPVNYSYVIEAKKIYNINCTSPSCTPKAIQNFTVCSENLRIPDYVLNSYDSLQCPDGTTSPSGAVCVGQCVSLSTPIQAINPVAAHTRVLNSRRHVQSFDNIIFDSMAIVLFKFNFRNLSPNFYYNIDFGIQITSNSDILALPGYFLLNTSTCHFEFNISVINLSENLMNVTPRVVLYNKLFVPMIPDLENTVEVDLIQANRFSLGLNKLFVCLLWSGTFSAMAMPYNLINLQNSDGSPIDLWLSDTGNNPESNGTTYETPPFDTNFWVNYGVSSLALPWIPFFMNCDLFGDRIYMQRLTETMENCTLYPPNETNVINPIPITGVSPKSDTCNIYLNCYYAENVQPTSSTRWFEILDEQTLFFLTKYPQSPSAFSNTFQAQDSSFTQSISDQSDNIIQVKFKPVGNVNGIPTTVTMDISYYQQDTYNKLLVAASVSLSDYSVDEMNAGMPRYLLIINYYPLGWFELLNGFQFNLAVYVLLFLGIGGLILGIGYVLYRLHLYLLKEPPHIHLRFYLLVSSLPRAVGVTFATLPMIIVAFSLGPFTGAFAGYTGDWGVDPPLSTAKVTQFHRGRIGMCMGFVAFTMFAYGARLLIPKPNPPKEEEGENEQKEGNVENEEKEEKEEKINKEKFNHEENQEEITDAANEHTEEKKNEETEHDEKKEGEENELPLWKDLKFKRRYFMIVCLAISIIISIKLEISYSPTFSANIFIFQTAFYILDILLYQLFFRLVLPEALLIVPILTSLFINKAVMMLAAPNFTIFIECYIVNFGFIVFQRIYLNPFIEYFEQALQEFTIYLVSKSSLIRKFLGNIVTNQLEEQKKLMSRMKENFSGERNDRMMGTMVEFSAQSAATFMLPLVYLFISSFAVETQIPKNYGVSQSNVNYYLLFSLVIIIPQILIDVLILHLIEGLYGYKIFDYLTYCNYRFKTRKNWWKYTVGVGLDKSLLPVWRSIDSMCFSSQFYFSITLASWGVVCLTFSFTIMIRNAFNPCSDPLIILLLLFVRYIGMALKFLFLTIRPYIKLWEPKSNKIFVEEIPADDSENQIVDLIDEYALENDIEHKIRTEIFKLKFLKKNIPWIIENLDKIIEDNQICHNYLRPRYYNLFEKHQETEQERDKIENRLELLNLLPNNKFNPDFELSFERDSIEMPKYKPVNKTAAKIGMGWLSQARFNIRLKKAIEDESVLKKCCDLCETKDHLKIVTLVPFEDILLMYRETFKGYALKIPHWKQFYFRNQELRTLCIDCAYLEQLKLKNDPRAFSSLTKVAYEELKSRKNQISRSTKAIARMWLDQARANIGSIDQDYEDCLQYPRY